MASEESRRGLLLLGVLLIAGNCVLQALRAAGSISYCYPLEEKRPAPGEPSLTVLERLAWTGLQWRLSRQKPSPRSKLP
jgi:hypothetical protein